MNQEINRSEKSYWILSAFFILCPFGAHQFYLGNIKAGFIRLGCSITLIGLPISIILGIKDCVQLYRGKLYDSKGLSVMTPQESSKETREKIDKWADEKNEKIDKWADGKVEEKANE